MSDGGVRFWDDAQPRLPATGYRVVVEQRVELPAPFVSPAPYVTEQRVEVTGRPSAGRGQWQVPVPASLNALPASGTKSQS